jgi:H+-transporting ATPase
VASTPLEAKTQKNPNAETASASDTASMPLINLTPKLVERVHVLYEELGRQDVLAVQELERAQNKSKAPTAQ